MSFLTSQPIDPAALVASVAAPANGAVTAFNGLVRAEHRGRLVVALEYTAYVDMAEAVCREIVAEAERRWSARIALQHRLGNLVVGEVAVSVVVATPHRAAAFDGCRWVIDEVKRRVPIWKRERYADGTEAWVEPTPDFSNRSAQE